MNALDAGAAERQMLRDSVRSLLAAHWPVAGAVERGQDAAAVNAVWKLLAEQGLAAFGTDAANGLGEALVVFYELGRAACPVPLLGALAANRAFRRCAEVPAQAREVLDAIETGSAPVALTLGAFDGDWAAGRAAYANGVLSGAVAFVEGGLTATHYLVLLDEPAGVAIVPAGAPGLLVAATPGLAVPSLSEVRFNTPPLAFIEVPKQHLADIAFSVRLACAARAMGAAQRAFDLAVEHAMVRRQFGQLIGQFQAIQHKLADCLTRLDGARLLIDNAAAAHDRGHAEWRVFTSAALAFAGPALRQVAIEAIHVLGAIGCAEEHEAPRHFRRVHADVVRFGGAPRACAELADYLLGPLE